MTRKQMARIILIGLGVVIVHLFIPEQYMTLHIIFRLLYFIPIVLAALISGRKGGVIAALAMSLAFVPHFFFAHMDPQMMTENAVAIVLFTLCGFFIGSFRDSSEVSLFKREQHEQVVPYREAEQQRVLFSIDGSSLCLSAAKWFGKRYALTKMSVVLFKVSFHDRDEILADTLAGKEYLEKEQEVEQSFAKIKQALIEGGIDEKNIETVVTISTEKVPVSDKILDYLREHEFDFILLCKHNKTKSEEFLFGDTAIQVMRKATVPMLVVKGIEEQMVQI